MKKAKNHSQDEKMKALRYFIIGLNLEEISKLMDIKVRTLEDWQSRYKFISYKRTTLDINKKAYELQSSGKSLVDIAKVFDCSTRTISRYILEYKKENKIK